MAPLHSKCSLPGTERLVEEFVRFQSDLPELLSELQLTEADLDCYADFLSLVYEWLATHRIR